jgi:hypothetical protein
VCLFHGGMHTTFCAFQNISLDYNLGNHFIFEQLTAILFIYLWAVGSFPSLLQVVSYQLFLQ